MSTNSASLVSMHQLMSKLQSHTPPNSLSYPTTVPNGAPLSDIIVAYLDTATESSWNFMKAVVTDFINVNSSTLYPSLRVVITLTDGKVAFDSSKGAANVFANISSLTNPINDNHNSRVSILSALLSSSGTGHEQKYSSSTGKFEIYQAVRMGASTANALGVVRVSILDA